MSERRPIDPEPSLWPQFVITLAIILSMVAGFITGFTLGYFRAIAPAEPKPPIEETSPF